MNDSIKLQHIAKGQRPQFSENPEVDRLMAIIMALASEVSVLRERLDSVEAVGEERGAWPAGAIGAYVPGEERSTAREQWRKDYLQRILYILEVEAAGDGGSSPK